MSSGIALTKYIYPLENPIILSSELGYVLDNPRFSSSSLGGSVPEEQGFAHGDGIPDDFKHFLEMHPGMSIEEAKRRFKNEQKQRSRVRLKH